jgi:hypothetical protein
MSFRHAISAAAFLLVLAHSLSLGDVKVLILRSVHVPPVVDGVVDEVWNQADSADGFFQTQPYFGKEPSETTVAKLLSTDEALYCLIVCQQQKSEVQDIATVHDETSGDVASLMLDTFGDKQTAYRFSTTAAGVQADSRWVDDARSSDYSWDGVWFSRSKVYPWGYVVEMEIPYKSLHYNGELTEWGLDFKRWIASRSEDLYWCPYAQNEGQRISKFGVLRLNGARPTVKGLNLEVYPVAIAKASYTESGKYKVEPDAGIDLFYNPSEQLTLQLTGNPDFAQIEADPYDFNISRYESRFDERRPFFTAGKEVFTAAGKDNNSGFYQPLELFYSRRIGKVLSDGTRVPLEVGAKAYGRLGSWEYGGFLARTGSVDYLDDGVQQNEPVSLFSSARIKKRVLDNSSLGLLFVGKRTPGRLDGVIDFDGAFRASDWQLAFQVARSITDGQGDFAGSAGFRQFSKSWGTMVRVRAIGSGFNVDQVGYVPWQGTTQVSALTGPNWFFETGYLSNFFLYGGLHFYYEEADLYTDRVAVLGWDMSFRDNWGYEIDLIGGKSKDESEVYTYSEIDWSFWFNVSPRWNGNFWGGYSHGYNFDRGYVAFYSWHGFYVEWKVLNTLELGTEFHMYVEGNPEGRVEDITYNSRPFISVTPVNNLNLRVYMDNVFVKSTDRVEHVILGFLFSYNFLPKSWIYLALNEVREREPERITAGETMPSDTRPTRLRVTDRAGVFKVKYLYYF